MAGNWRTNLKDFVGKRLVYRLPLPLREFLLPRYNFLIEPAQLSCLVRLIEETRCTSGGGGGEYL